MKCCMLTLFIAGVSASATGGVKDELRAPANADVTPYAYIIMFKHHVSDSAVLNHYAEIHNIHNNNMEGV